MGVSSPTDFYLNQQYSEMKLGVRNQSVETTKAVAEQFESLLVQQMLASMGSAVTVDESNESSTVDFYQEMYDKQLAVSISKQGGLCIAKMLKQHLPGGAQLEGAQSGADQLTNGQLTQVTGKSGNSLHIGAPPPTAQLLITNLATVSLPMPNRTVTDPPVTNLAESNLNVTY
jgi:Rod binding domain-containing protein